MFKVNNKDTRTTPNDVVLVSLLLNFNIFHTFYSVSIVDFQQVNISYVVLAKVSLLEIAVKLYFNYWANFGPLINFYSPWN